MHISSSIYRRYSSHPFIYANWCTCPAMKSSIAKTDQKSQKVMIEEKFCPSIRWGDYKRSFNLNKMLNEYLFAITYPFDVGEWKECAGRARREGRSPFNRPTASFWEVFHHCVMKGEQNSFKELVQSVSLISSWWGWSILNFELVHPQQQSETQTTIV